MADAWSTKPGERPNKPDIASIIREAQNSTEVRSSRMPRTPRDRLPRSSSLAHARAKKDERTLD